MKVISKAEAKQVQGGFGPYLGLLGLAGAAFGVGNAVGKAVGSAVNKS